MALSAEAIADLVTTTQNELGELKWTDLASNYQNYVVLPQILKKKKIRIRSGAQISRNIMLKHSNAARFVGLYATDVVAVKNVMSTITVPWRHGTTNYAIERREVAMNREPRRIVELVQEKRADAMIAMAELLEENFWHTISDDDVTPFGIQYWVVWGSGSSTGAHTYAASANHGNFASGPGGLSSTNKGWGNFTFTYTNLDKADGLPKLRKALRECGYKPPVSIPQYDSGPPSYGLYVNGDTIQTMEDIGEGQNENLGRDIAVMDGQIMVRKIPVVWVSYLDDYSTSDPIWGIDWSVFKPYFLDGEYLNEQTEPGRFPQHTVTKTFVDLTANYVCENRRKLFVGAKADPESGV
jgi:hypothetical protein